LEFAARPFSHVNGHLHDVETGFAEAKEGLDLRRAARVRDSECGHRSPVRCVHPARRIVEGATERGSHGAAQDGRSQPAAPRRLVAVCLVSLAGREARAHGDVGVSLPHDFEKARQLFHGMLTVGVDAADVRIRIRFRVGIAGGDPLLQAAVLPEGEDFRAVRPRDRCGLIRRAVVDDENVARRQGRRVIRLARPAGSPPRSRQE
jgi:hypothetical protein